LAMSVASATVPMTKSVSDATFRQREELSDMGPNGMELTGGPPRRAQPPHAGRPR
jgi:hypothetical protein